MKHNHTRGLARMTLIAAAAMSALAVHAAGVNTLVGWASLPAATVAEGPTTGQFGGT